MQHVVTRHEPRRGCGYRKPGGLYFVGEKVEGCSLLPLPLHVCPTCHAGIKFSRGFTWVDPSALFVDVPPCDEGDDCPIQAVRSARRCGLLWIGESFYPTPAHFLEEARTQSVSRRVPAVPHGFKVGETWILLAHRKAIVGDDGQAQPGVFSACRPSAVEYVVKDDDTDEKVQRVVSRGLTPVRVIPMEHKVLEQLRQQVAQFGAPAGV